MDGNNSVSSSTLQDGTEFNHITTGNNLSIRQLLEIRKPCASDYDCAQLLATKYTEFANCNFPSLRQKIKSTARKVSQLRRNKSITLTDYLSGDFKPPQSKENRQPSTQNVLKLQAANETMKQEKKSLKRKNSELSSYASQLLTEQAELTAKYEVCLNILQEAQNKYSAVIEDSDIKKLKQKAQISEAQYRKAAEQIDILGSKLKLTQEKLSRFNTRNVVKREKRTAQKLESLQTQNCGMKKECDSLACNIKMQDEQISSLNATVKQLKEKAKYQTKKERRERKKTSDLISYYEEREIDNEFDGNLQRQRIVELENMIQESETVKTFEDGRYINEIREVVMTLVTECNVSLRKVNDVICTVLKGLTGKLPPKLPSHGVLCRLLYEAKFIAQKHVATEILSQADISEGEVVTLHNDGTTKHHVEYEGYQVTLPDGKTLSAGIQEVSTQSAEKNIEAFKEIVRQLAAAKSSCETSGIEKMEASIIAALQCTMSDQGPSNPKFFHFLSELRSTYLPEVVQNWDILSSESKSKFSKMCNYYCKLHLLMNFETAVGQTALQFEQNVVIGKNPYAFYSEPSGTKRLAKNSSKALTLRGSDQSGVGSLWYSFLQNIGEKNFLINIEHDRLNTLFYQSAAVYHHQHHILNFLSSLPQPNDLLKTLLFDIQENVYIAGIRALGIIDKLITGPYWRMLEEANNILSINEDLERFRQCLESWGLDASPLMSGEIVLFPQIDIHKDCLFDSLFMETDNPVLDAFCQMALELYCQAMLLVLERQAKDQLLEGKFYSPDEHTSKISRSVPATNMASERDFGQLDWLMKMKPSGSLTCFEAVILWTNNKTSKWLDELTSEERSKILEEARKNAPDLLKKFRDRQEKIMLEKRDRLKEKTNLKDRKEELAVQKRADATSSLEKFGGLWRDEGSIKDNMDRLSHKDGIAALHAQILFHKDVLRSKGPKELFQKSSKGKAYDKGKLCENLIQIVVSNKLESTPNSSHLTYRPVNEVKDMVSESKKSNILKLSKQRMRIKIQDQKTKLANYTKDPYMLVGCQVKHFVREPGEDAQWLDGYVKQVATVKKDPLSTLYTLIYSELPSEIWTFPLLRDMKNGDLLIL